MKTGLRAIPYLQWGFLATLAVFLTAAFIFYRGLSLLEKSEDKVVHTHEVLEHLQSIESESEAIESAYRGFALTGDEASLNGYREGVLLVARRESALGELTRDNPSQQRDLQALKALIDQKIRFADSIIELRRTSGLAAVSDQLRLRQGDELMSEIRGVIARMADEEHRLLHKRDAEAEHQSQRTKGLLILQAILCLAFALIVLSVRRSLTGIELAAARQIEEQFRTLVERVQDCAIFMIDPRGKVLTWNIGAERLIGYEADEIIGQDFLRFYPSDEGAPLNPHDYLRIAAGSGLFQTEGWRTRKDGSRFLADATITPSFDKAGNLLGFIKITRDITERKKAEQLLAQKVADLKRSNDELEQFAYVASHDLQEPLRMISSYTLLLAKRYKGRLDSDADDFISFAVDGTQRMKALIQALLLYSRTGTASPAASRISSDHALDEALGNLRSAVGGSGATITRDSLPEIAIEHSQLVQVFQNLVGNAIKYRGAAAPSVHISATRNAKEEWVFSVKDNGLGIEPQYLEKIFVIFQRLHARDEFEGTGIGLAICKKIVERQGGRIWAESEPGRGSTFYFALPEMEGQ